MVGKGDALACTVMRVLIVYTCIILVHSVMYWGKRYLRSRARR